MFVQVTTLAEITDHMGVELLPQAFLQHAYTKPKGLSDISLSMLQWSEVALPSTTCWQTWTTTIQMLYTGSQTGT